jgi:ligand-binding sensor domain-containing protein
MDKGHRQRRAVVALGILLACCARVFALGDPSLDISQYAHTAWKVRDGFVGSEINSIAQTPDGYIWLATQFGLFRFDGVRNVPWQPPQDQHLPPGTIFSLLVDRGGTLWIGAKGLASFKDGKLTHYPELDGHYIFKILEDHDGTIWASGVTDPIGKLCAIRNGNIQCYGGDGTLGLGALSLYEDSKGNLWAGVLNGLWQWKPVYELSLKTQTARSWSDGKGESTDSLTEKPSPIPFAALPNSSGPRECSATGMALCGSELRTEAFCTCTREGQMYLGSRTDSQAKALEVSSRIVKTIFG